MKKSKFFKMICLMISLVMIFSMSAFAVDESNIPAVFEAVEHDHDSECVDNNNMNDEQDFLEYYRDNYGVNLIEVEIDGEIYYINEDIEITEDFINSIKTNAENGTFDISISENIEHTHADEFNDDIINEECIHTENAVYEEQDTIEYYRDNYGVNLIEIEIDEVMYYINEELIDSIDIESIPQMFEISNKESFIQSDVYTDRNDEPSMESVTEEPCYPGNHVYKWKCGLNWCNNCGGAPQERSHSYTKVEPIYLKSSLQVCFVLQTSCAYSNCSSISGITNHGHYGSQVQYVNVGTESVCQEGLSWCIRSECSLLIQRYPIASHHYTFGKCTCNYCGFGYNHNAGNHRFNQRTVILRTEYACWVSEMYCYNSGCNYFYSAYVERNHNRANIYAVCQSCGWKY